MTSVTKHRLRQAAVKAVFNEIVTKQARYYYFLGKTDSFASEPETPLSSVEYESKTRRNILLMKLIKPSDISLVIPRNDWTFNTVYDQYDVKVDDGNQNTYAMVIGTYDVYKCLDNNNGAASTVQPSGRESDAFTTLDGYKWKFLYNVPLGLRAKFLTIGHMPVANSLNARFFSNGSIENLIIENAGSGYVQGSSSLVVTGDGTGADLSPIITSGQLTGVTINSAGSGYSYANVAVQGIGTGAVVVVDLSIGDANNIQAVIEMLAVPGSIDSIGISTAGTGYNSATATITGDGVGATASVSVASGGIEKVNMLTIGSGYTFADVTIIGDGTGAGTYANISPPLGHGHDTPAELYASSIMFYSDLSTEKYGGMVLSNDYRQMGIIRSPRNLANGTNITAPASSAYYALTAVFDASVFPVGTVVQNGTSTQFTVAEVITGTTQGMTLYSATGTPVITSETMTKVGGLGEQFVINTSVKRSLIDTGIASPCFIAYGTIDPSIVNDDILTIGTKEFIVVSKDVTLGKIMLLPMNGGIVAAGNVLNKIMATITVASITVDSVDQPNVDKNSGDIIFIDNRSAFTQSAEQVVTFRTVINF
jgi:hypothetical protein